LLKNYSIAWAFDITSAVSHQSIPMLCLSGVVGKVRLHAPCLVASLLHNDSLKTLHAVAATLGICPFPIAPSASILWAISSIPLKSLERTSSEYLLRNMRKLFSLSEEFFQGKFVLTLNFLSTFLFRVACRPILLE